MGFFERLWNLVKGAFGGAVSNAEVNNPEAVYETAIDERLKRHRELKKAVGNIVYLRNKLEAELDTKTKELAEINAQIPVALDGGDDEVTLVLLQKKNELEKAIGEVTAEQAKMAAQAEDAKKALVSFQGEIEKLKRERDEMLAKKSTAEARIKIQESLDGMSTDADIKALENVREHIGKLAAQADVGNEMKNDSLDARLAEIRKKTGDVTAKSQLEELKKLHAAKAASAVAEGAAGGAAGGSKKTI
ncbi:MAG: PspA/IM30 family protein [Deltaproteobacteria bacterium]|nr:PspA/IM30 family protein [Deltaproteobacteria bacterium]